MTAPTSKHKGRKQSSDHGQRCSGLRGRDGALARAGGRQACPLRPTRGPAGPGALSVPRQDTQLGSMASSQRGSLRGQKLGCIRNPEEGSLAELQAPPAPDDTAV